MFIRLTDKNQASHPTSTYGVVLGAFVRGYVVKAKQMIYIAVLCNS